MQKQLKFQLGTNLRMKIKKHKKFMFMYKSHIKSIHSNGC